MGEVIRLGRIEQGLVQDEPALEVVWAKPLSQTGTNRGPTAHLGPHAPLAVSYLPICLTPRSPRV